MLLRKGSRGKDVALLQLRLNTRLVPSPRLNPDGIFGPKTHNAVVAYQKQSSLVIDGIVGPKTIFALRAPPISSAPPNLQKFAAELGGIDDFVFHVRRIESRASSPGEVFDELVDFYQTDVGSRYLIVKKDNVSIIDFRHFFAAAGQAFNAALSRQKDLPFSRGEGNAVLLGVGNEIAQCMSEAIEMELNSCFSSEDLGSNRLGARWGELVTIQIAEASDTPLYGQLRRYLETLEPVSPHQIKGTELQGSWDQILESISAILHGIGDLLIPSAY